MEHSVARQRSIRLAMLMGWNPSQHITYELIPQSHRAP
jgi:hypothetical protein